MLTDEKLPGAHGRRMKKMSISSSSSDKKLHRGHGTKKRLGSTYSSEMSEWSVTSPCKSTSYRGVKDGDNEVVVEADMAECKGMQEEVGDSESAGKGNMSDGHGGGGAKGDREDSKRSKSDETEGTKTGVGGKNRGGAVVRLARAQVDTGSVVHSKANLNGEDSNSKGELAVTVCQSGEDERERKTETEGGELGTENDTEAEGDEFGETEVGVKNRRSVVDDNSKGEQLQANCRGDIAAIACQCGKADSEVVKAKAIPGHTQSKNLNEGTKQRRKCKYVVTDNAHYGKEREDTGYSISDSDIAHRNEIIRREVEETMEFGAQLGLFFKEDGQVKAQELLEKNKNINRRKA